MALNRPGFATEFQGSERSRRLGLSPVLKIRVSGVPFPPWPSSNSMNPDGFAHGRRTIGPRVGRYWGVRDGPLAPGPELAPGGRLAAWKPGGSVWGNLRCTQGPPPR